MSGYEMFCGCDASVHTNQWFMLDAMSALLFEGIPGLCDEDQARVTELRERMPELCAADRQAHLTFGCTLTHLTEQLEAAFRDMT